MKPALIFVALSLLVSACSKEAPPPAKIPRPALTHLVGELAGAGSNVYSGEIRARNESALAFRVGGKIVARLVDAGTQVKAGQVLARLDAADTGLQASVALAQYQLAEAEVKRYRELRNKGFVSQSALDVKEVAFKAAASQSGLTRNQSDYTTLRADHDGVVAATLAEAGQVVAAGQPVLRLAQAGGREVAIAIPEAQFAQRKLGDKAEIVLLAGEGKALSGRLRELSPSADPASRTYAARVLLDGAANPALGMTARVSFGGDQRNGGFLVPLSAIFQQGEQAALWIVGADDTLSLRPVKVAAWRDDGAVIASGVAAGERIVSAGVHKLTVGEKIRIISTSVSNGSGSAQ